MQDAIAALESALDELREAQEALPEDLAEEMTSVIERTRTVLETVRGKSEAGGSGE